MFGLPRFEAPLGWLLLPLILGGVSTKKDAIVANQLKQESESRPTIDGMRLVWRVLLVDKSLFLSGFLVCSVNGVCICEMFWECFRNIVCREAACLAADQTASSINQSACKKPEENIDKSSSTSRVEVHNRLLLILAERTGLKVSSSTARMRGTNWSRFAAMPFKHGNPGVGYL